MTKTGRGLMAAVVLSIAVSGISGCQKKEGPLERAGREIDRAAEKTGQQLEKALEKTGEKIKDAAKDVKK